MHDRSEIVDIPQIRISIAQLVEVGGLSVRYLVEENLDVTVAVASRLLVLHPERVHHLVRRVPGATAGAEVDLLLATSPADICGASRRRDELDVVRLSG